jgi:hypothetical protein
VCGQEPHTVQIISPHLAVCGQKPHTHEHKKRATTRCLGVSLWGPTCDHNIPMFLLLFFFRTRQVDCTTSISPIEPVAIFIQNAAKVLASRHQVALISILEGFCLATSGCT